MIEHNHQNAKISAIREEFHGLNDLEIQPGFRVNDLTTRVECHRAIALVQGEADTIVTQIEDARLRHAKGQEQLDTAWLMRAQNAIRWKRRIIKAIQAKIHAIPRPTKSRELREFILEVIGEDIGEDRMSSYVLEARRRFQLQEAANIEAELQERQIVAAPTKRECAE